MKNTDKAFEMQNTKIEKLIFKYFLFTFSALLFSAFYNIADSLFVSYGVGDNAMGGVSVVYPFVVIQSAVAQTVGSGAAVFVSKCLGAKEYKTAGEYTFNAMILFYIFAVLLSAVCFAFMTPVLKLFGSTDEIMPYAKQYFTIIAAGNVFSTGFSSVIRAEGAMRYSLAIWLIPTAVNIAADYLLIFVFRLGVSGAALGTVICQTVSFAMSVLFFTKFSCQNFKGVKIRVKLIKEITATGIPILFQLGGSSIVLLVINNILSQNSGTLGVNSFAYVSKIISFALVPFNAFSQAVSPVIGYNCGAKNYHRTRLAISRTLLFCNVCAVACFAVSPISAPYLVRIFTSSAQLIEYGGKIIRLIAPSVLFLPLPLICASFFQAVGNKRFSYLFNFIIPTVICIFAELFSRLSDNGVWYGVVFGCIVCFFISFVIYFKKIKTFGILSVNRS